MKKTLKWIGISLLGLIVVLFFLFQYFQGQTKQASPEDTITFSQGETTLSVFYNRPSKKGREIFGGLVPYGEVWRTGANEATTLTTNQAISIDGKPLPAGEYTLWTIPGEDEWTFIVNSKQYSWGVSWGAKASREPEADVLKVQVPVEALEQPVEMFTMSFVNQIELTLVLAWDATQISVPIELP